MTDISQLYPKWQFHLREAAENLNTRSYARTDAELEAMSLRGKARSQGCNLRFVLTHILGIPIAAPSIDHNYYTVDGYWFSLKHDSEPGKDEAQPVYVSSSTGKKNEAVISFTLYVGKVVADPAFPDWPKRQAIVGRDIHLMYTSYSRLRAALAETLDELETTYRDAIPCYQAWKELQTLPTDAAMRQDFFLQLIRRALREMPAAELLNAMQPEPIEVPQAGLADSEACMDGLLLSGVEKAEDVTLASLEVSANRLLAILDEFSPGNYDPFNDEDEPDDDVDEEDDDEEDDDGPYDDDVDKETISPDLDESTEPDTTTEAVPV